MIQKQFDFVVNMIFLLYLCKIIEKVPYNH